MTSSKPQLTIQFRDWPDGIDPKAHENLLEIALKSLAVPATPDNVASAAPSKITFELKNSKHINKVTVKVGEQLLNFKGDKSALDLRPGRYSVVMIAEGDTGARAQLSFSGLNQAIKPLILTIRNTGALIGHLVITV